MCRIRHGLPLPRSLAEATSTVPLELGSPTIGLSHRYSSTRSSTILQAICKEIAPLEKQLALIDPSAQLGKDASSSNGFPAIRLHKPAHWRSSPATFSPTTSPPPLISLFTRPPTSRYLQSCPADPPLLPPSSCPSRPFSCLSSSNSSHHHQHYDGGPPKTSQIIETNLNGHRQCVRISASSRSRYLFLDPTKCLFWRRQSGWRRSLSTRRRI